MIKKIKNPSPIFYLELENLIGLSVIIKLYNSKGWGNLIFYGILEKITKFNYKVENSKSYIYFERFSIQKIENNVIILKNQDNLDFYTMSDNNPNIIKNMLNRITLIRINQGYSLNNMIVTGILKYNKPLNIYFIYQKNKISLTFSQSEIKEIYLHSGSVPQINISFSS